jgi:hypothetical protein
MCCSIASRKQRQIQTIEFIDPFLLVVAKPDKQASGQRMLSEGRGERWPKNSKAIE